MSAVFKPFSGILNNAWFLAACATMCSSVQASETEISSVAKEILTNGGFVLNCKLSEACSRGDCSPIESTVEIALSSATGSQLPLDTEETAVVRGTWIEPSRHSDVTGVQVGKVATIIASGFGDAVLIASVDLKTLEINSSEHLSTAFGTSNQYGSCEAVN